MTVPETLAALVEDTDGHGTGMQSEATIPLGRRRVTSHEVSSSACGGVPNASIPPRYAEEGASISINHLQATAYSVRCAPASRRA
jgi:hypothetical protein